jgi:hypothetical protein
MKTYRSVSIILAGLLLALFLAVVIFQPENSDIPIIVFFALCLLADTLFMIREKKEIRNSRKYIFPFVEFTWRKYFYWFLMVFGIAWFIYNCIRKTGITTPDIMFAFFGLLGLRGIIFDRQTLVAIRIDSENIEYGFGFFDCIKIASLKSYSIDYEGKILILNKAKKDIRIKIKYVEDIKKLDEVLKEKIKGISLPGSSNKLS